MRFFVLLAGMLLMSSGAMAVALDSLMPPAQQRFIKTAAEYARRYQAAQNALQKSAIWKERSVELVKSVKPLKDDPKNAKWVGVLESMGTTSDGHAWIVVRISPKITLSTWNNAVSDSGYGTLIKNGSKQYKTLAALVPGAVIKFQYTLSSKGKSMFEENRMLEPDFVTSFSEIEPIAGASAAK